MVLLWWSSFGGLIATIPSFTLDTGARIPTSTSNIFAISLIEWISFCALSMSGLLAYFLYTRACQMIDPTLVAVIRSTEIIFAFLVQILIMHQFPDYIGIIGAILVLISVTAFAIQNYNSKRT